MSEPIFTTQLLPDGLLNWVREQIGNDRRTFRIKYDYVLRCKPDLAYSIIRLTDGSGSAALEQLAYRWGNVRVFEDDTAETPYLERHEHKSLEARR